MMATTANLASQRVMLLTTDEVWVLFPSIAVGTLVGLIIKYLLDKRWIFFDTAQGVKMHGQQFMLYALTGVVTTAIFWGSEIAFWFQFETHVMREVGAVLGLAIGYAVKYRLDQKFVFRGAA